MSNIMKDDWNERAKENAFYYISSFKKNWSEKEFFEWGKIQVDNITAKFVKERTEHSKWTALEIGCGIGRMTRHFSDLFDTVYAYDVSEEMIEEAKKIHKNLENIHFLSGNGQEFPELKEDSVDYVFCGWTFQHIPSKQIVERNISEISRVLKKEGKFQLNAGIREIHGIKDLLIVYVNPSLREKLASIMGKKGFSSTWRGAAFTRKEFLKLLGKHGLHAKVRVYEYENPFLEETEKTELFVGGKQ